MPRLVLFALLATVAGLVADDKPAKPTLPKFKDYLPLPNPVVGRLKAVDGDTLTVILPEFSLSGGSRKRPPKVKTKEVPYDLRLHPDALVRWTRKPDRRDDKGRLKPYTQAELDQLKAPHGAPGYLGFRAELAADQLVELTLLVPTRVPPEELAVKDVRVKWVLVQGAPPDPKAAKPAAPEPKKK